MMLKENLYKNALSIIEEIYNESKYNKDVDLYRSYDIINATNDAQIASKEWLVDNLAPFLNKKYLEFPLRDVLIQGAWYGVTGMLLREHIGNNHTKIWNVDSDPLCEKYGNMLQRNNPSLENNSFHTDDAIEYYFDRADSYQLIINTSCEHMEQEDIDLILGSKPINTIACFQSNNYHDEPEHINTHNNVEEFAASLNLARVFWSGTLKPSEDYERYMVIGI